MLRQLLDRPIAVTMVVLVAIVLGVVAVFRLPVSLIPEVDVPYIAVQVSHRQYSAREMEEKILDPLRQQLAQIDGLKDLSTSANDGRGTVLLSFDFGTDIDYCFIEANEKVDRAMMFLPPIERPRLIKYSASDIPVFYLNISLKEGAKSSFGELSRLARSLIVKRLEQLPSVSIADASGYDIPQYVIEPDMGKLQELGFSLQEFENCLKSSDISLGNLTIRDREYQYDINFKSLVGGKEDIENIYFKKDSRIIQLKDVAKVYSSEAERVGCIYDGRQRIISIAVIKQGNCRMSEVRKETEDLISSMSEDYPEIDFRITRNQSELLDYSIRSLLQNILFALLATIFVIIVFFRDIRLSMLSALTVPVSILLSLLCFWIFGISVNILSLSGLLLGVGLMVDNSIILIDNLTERYKQDQTKDSVIYGTREVAGAMMSSTLTTCAVFIPVVFTKGIAASLFSEQAAAIVITLLASYIVTVVCVPVFYYAWFRSGKESSCALLQKILDINSRLAVRCERISSWFLRKRKAIFVVLPVCLLGLIILFGLLPKTRLPEMKNTETVLDIDWNEPLSFEANLERILDLENNLGQSVEEFVTYAGHQQYILGHTEDMADNMAEIYIRCKTPQRLDEVVDALSGKLAENYQKAFYEFRESSNVLDFVFSDKEPYLQAVFRPLTSGFPDGGINKLENLLSEIGKNQAISISPLRLKPTIVLMANMEKMALYGVKSSELVDILKRQLGGSKIFDVVEGDEIKAVVVKTGDGSIWDNLNDAFVLKGSSRIPVRELIRETFTEDFQTISGNIAGEAVPVEIKVERGRESETVEFVREAVRDNGAFDVSFSGSWLSGKHTASELVVALAMALMILYLILASQFESLKQPLIILSEVVIDFLVVFVFLWTTGISLNVMTMIGLIVTSGIVINDSILKVDTINKLVNSGKELDVAIREAGQRRLKSIIMTSLTTILAVLPFLGRSSLGDYLQYPMAVVIIVGMVVGTFVSVFIVPALYRALYSKL